MPCFQCVGCNATPSNTPGQLITANGATSNNYVCGNSVVSVETTLTTGYYQGCLAYVLEVDGVSDPSGASGISACAYTISAVNSGNIANCPASCNTIQTYDCVGGNCQINASGTGAYSSLSACQSSCAWFDCLNGACTRNTVYSTAGNYKSLADCNAVCGGATCPLGQSCFDPNNLPCPTCPDCPTCPACPDCPDCPDSDGVCPPCPPAPPSAGSCPSGQTCQLHTGEDVNFVNISAPIFLGSCDSSGNPVLGSQLVQVIQGTEAGEFLKFQELAQIQGNSYCNIDVAGIPESWLIRPESHRAQVIYQFAEIDNSGNITGAPKYPITVPHHIADKPSDPLPNYKRGNWEIIYVLSDNSKVTIHSLDEENGMIVLNAIKSRIVASYLTNAYQSKSCMVITDNPIAQINVRNRSAKYYSTGTKNAIPDWIAKW